LTFFFLFGSKIDDLKDNFESSNILYHTSLKKKTEGVDADCIHCTFRGDSYVKRAASA
jgi:hypothetical protein